MMSKWTRIAWLVVFVALGLASVGCPKPKSCTGCNWSCEPGTRCDAANGENCPVNCICTLRAGGTSCDLIY